MTPEQRLINKKPKAQNIVIESKQTAIDKRRAHQAANVEWPEHVKVQVIDGYTDTRFKPDQGHIGSFMQDWNKRRAA